MKFGREILKDVQGYVPGEQPKGVGIVKLNTNENPYPPSVRVLEAVQTTSTEAIRRYPDPVAARLRDVAAEHYGFESADWVVAGNGMDELLAIAIRTFTDPGDTVLSPYPTYVLYETLALLHGARFVGVDLDGEFQLTEDFYRTPARICFLPRPNAPSGVCPPRSAVERLCREFDGLVVIDEAYADFADDNCVDFPKRFENAIVMRTFSKSYSLAGMRLGLAFARPEIIAEFMKTKDSYNLNAATQSAGVAALQDQPYTASCIQRVRTNRARLSEELGRLGFYVPESKANFVLAHWKRNSPTARDIFDQLCARAVFVRYFDAPRLRDALRISVGSDLDIERLLDALKEILGPERTV